MKTAQTYRWLLLLVIAVVGLSGCSGNDNDNPLAPAVANSQLTDKDGNTIVDIAVGAGTFETLVTALGEAGLVDTLADADGGPFTVFAPNDDAFAKLPAGFVTQLLAPRNSEKLQELLLYHVVNGEIFSNDLRRFQFTPTLANKYLWIRKYWGTVRVNNAKVIAANLDASNGVVHVIDTVLIPRGFELVPEEVTPTLNIVETAQAAGVFNTLLLAAGEAGLAGTLADGGPFTVFAPTDAAFENLPDGLVAALLDNKDKLAELLLYHVLAGEVAASDLDYYQRVATLEGSKVRIIKWFGNIWVNNAKVSTADVRASNGVIHIINRVLIPRDFTLESKGVTYDAKSLQMMLKSFSDEELPPTDLDVRYLEAVN